MGRFMNGDTNVVVDRSAGRAAAVDHSRLSDLSARGCCGAYILLDDADRKPDFSTGGTREIGKNHSLNSEVLPVGKRHSPEEIAQALRQAEARTPVSEIIRRLGVHANTFL